MRYTAGTDGKDILYSRMLLTSMLQYGAILMSRLLGFAFAACLVAQSGLAADGDKVVGTWKLVS